MSTWFNDNGTWHFMERSWTDGHHFTALASCGLEAEWNRMSIDRLPGGGEKVCEICVPVVQAAPPPEEPVEKPKAAPKKRAKKV